MEMHSKKSSPILAFVFPVINAFIFTSFIFGFISGGLPETGMSPLFFIASALADPLYNIVANKDGISLAIFSTIFAASLIFFARKSGLTFQILNIVQPVIILICILYFGGYISS